jgi:cytochrome c
VNAIEGPAARLVGSDGFIGWDDPLRPLRIRKYPLLVQSVGARWPYATTLIDYIRRAMPYGAPKSLTSDETYALTAFLLYRHGVVNQGAIMNASSLPKVIMPGLANSVMGD